MHRARIRTVLDSAPKYSPPTSPNGVFCYEYYGYGGYVTKPREFLSPRASLSLLLGYAPPSRVTLATARQFSIWPSPHTWSKRSPSYRSIPIRSPGTQRPACVVIIGKDIGMWFGPSAAAGASRIIVEAFLARGLDISAFIFLHIHQENVFELACLAPALPTTPACQNSIWRHKKIADASV
ncbi:hypothetical protein B0H13DRAFT_1851060 [Mycena leptocephala]|nr:hypothetical protein B0H13DRAFT_1851060 [Mycena leptocephala]